MKFRLHLNEGKAIGPTVISKGKNADILGYFTGNKVNYLLGMFDCLYQVNGSEVMRICVHGYCPSSPTDIPSNIQ
jgi:hypothetical protein